MPRRNGGASQPYGREDTHPDPHRQRDRQEHRAARAQWHRGAARGGHQSALSRLRLFHLRPRLRIDGEQGVLLYRGYPIEQLAEKSSFIEVAYLLLYGDLPNEEQLDAFNQVIV